MSDAECTDDTSPTECGEDEHLLGEVMVTGEPLPGRRFQQCQRPSCGAVVWILEVA